MLKLAKTIEDNPTYLIWNEEESMTMQWDEATITVEALWEALQECDGCCLDNTDDMETVMSAALARSVALTAEEDEDEDEEELEDENEANVVLPGDAEVYNDGMASSMTGMDNSFGRSVDFSDGDE